ncbi:MAG: hypothetical protein ACSHXD_02005 [Marinosulfonomonas sp.]
MVIQHTYSEARAARGDSRICPVGDVCLSHRDDPIATIGVVMFRV